MAFNVTIGGGGSLFIGEDKIFRFEIVDQDGNPVDASAWDLLFDVRLKDTSPTSLLSKTATVAGLFNTVRAANLQRALITVTDTEMNLFKAKIYRWSLKRMDAGVEVVVGWGNFSPQKATAP